VEHIKREGPIGFATATKAQKQSYDNMKDQVLAEVRKTFRPEFINRLDDIIVFHELSREQIGEIVELMLKDLQKRLSERKLKLELTQSAKNWLADTGYDPTYGARPLRRAIERYVENPLAGKILSGEYLEGDTIIVNLVDDELVFSKS
jgi:ATP-dependent Clp protease ATP-binding subunit ClpC